MEMQKLARVGLCVNFNGQAKELRRRFEQQEPAPVPDQIFKDFTHNSTQNESNLISKAFWSWPWHQLNPDALAWLIALW